MPELKIGTPMPHGGNLVERVVRDPQLAKKLIKGCPIYDLKPTLANGIPVRHVYREIMSVCYGFFSPLEGSMTEAEVRRVLKERRLLSGWLFPYPILFDISEEDYKKLGVASGDRVLLRLKGEPFAILDVEEVYRIDNRIELADKVFGTPETVPEVVRKRFDKKHPGWAIYANHNPVILAGKYTIVNEPKLIPPFDRYWYPPKKAREDNQKRGWVTVINHQTRNVPHLGHEFLLKNAAYTGDIEPCHGIQVNAIIGAKRIGDYPDEAIVEAHDMLNKAGYLDPKRHRVTICLWDMRYGNPLESLLHGVIRQNMGCTHHMFGRDHAAVGDYYDPYATQILWSKGVPSMGFPAPPNQVENGLQIRPQNMAEFLYCPHCGEIAYNRNCVHIDEQQRFSGSFIRSMILEGVFPPPVIMRPEVYRVVVKWWKELGYPFVNKKYLIEKSETLEVEMPHMEI